MTTYYVRTSGSNTNNGLTAATAFATIAKAVSMPNPDAIWVGGGTYRISSGITLPSTGGIITGDVDGSQTGDPGEVIITTYSADNTTPATAHIFYVGNASYWTLRRLTLMQGSTGANGIYISGSSEGLYLLDLTIHSYLAGIVFNNLTFGTVHDVQIDRCRIFTAYGAAVYLILPSSSTGSNVNADIQIQNCVLFGNQGVRTYTGTVANTYRTGGITVYNCFIVAGSSAIETSGSACATSSTARVFAYNNMLFSLTGGPVIDAQGTSQITENANMIVGATAYANVTQGASSTINHGYNWRFSMGHEKSWGASTRPFGELPPKSALANFTLVSAPSPNTPYPASDIHQIERPASGNNQLIGKGAIGPFETGNTGVRDNTVYRTSAPSLRVTGPGYQDFELPVTANRYTTVRIWVFRNGNNADGKPKMELFNSREVGIFNYVYASDSGNANEWNSLAMSFTPASDGIVTVRLSSFAGASGSDTVWWDDFSYS